MKSLKLFILPFALFLFSLLVFILFLPPFIIQNTDEYNYITGIILFKYSPLGLGRILFILFYHLLLKIFSIFINIPPLEAYKYQKVITMFLGSTTIVTFFYLLKRLFKNTYIAVVSSLLVLSNYTFLRYSGSSMPEISMLFTLLLSIYLLYNGIHRSKLNYILVAAVVYGLSLNFGEKNILYFPYLLFILIRYKKATFRLCLLFILLVLFTTIQPLYFLILKYGNSFITTTTTWYTHNVHYINILSSFYGFHLLYLNLTPQLLFLAIIGALFLLPKLRWNIFLIFIPLVITPIFAPFETRNFIPLWFIITPFATYGGFRILTLIFRYLKAKLQYQDFVLLFICLVYLLISIYGFYKNKLPSDNKYSLSYKEYEKMVLTKIPNTSVLFLVGDKTWLIANYLQPLVRPKWKVIRSGWSWQGEEKAKEKILKELKDKNLVLIDIQQYENWENKDIDNLIKKFNIEPYTDSIYRVVKLSEG